MWSGYVLNNKPVGSLCRLIFFAPSFAVIVGPSSSGKGELMRALMSSVPSGVRVVSIGMGDIIRERMKINDRTADLLKECTGKREFAPDQIACELFLAEFMRRVSPEIDVVITEGFPRNRPQLHYAQRIFEPPQFHFTSIDASLPRCLKQARGREGRNDDGEQEIIKAYGRYVDHELPIVHDALEMSDCGVHVIRPDDTDVNWHIRNEASRVWWSMMSCFGRNFSDPRYMAGV